MWSRIENCKNFRKLIMRKNMENHLKLCNKKRQIKIFIIITIIIIIIIFLIIIIIILIKILKDRI